MVDEKSHTNYLLCSECKGACCTFCAGAYIPSDFSEQITEEFIKKQLAGGRIAIDWWEGDVMGNQRARSFYMRARHVNEPVIKGSWGGRCVNLTSSGCTLSFSERPYQCKVLVPKGTKINDELDLKCESEGKIRDKGDIAKEWYEFQDIFDKVVDNFYDNR